MRFISALIIAVMSFSLAVSDEVAIDLDRATYRGTMQCAYPDCP